MGKLRVAVRLVKERLQRRIWSVLFSAQVRRLTYRDEQGRLCALFELKKGNKLACYGGLAEESSEQSFIPLAAMRELNEELGLGPKLSRDEQSGLTHRAAFGGTYEGPEIRASREMVTIPGHYTLRSEPRGRIDCKVVFGIEVRSYAFEAELHRSLPAWFALSQEKPPYGGVAVYDVHAPSGERGKCLVVAVNADGSVLTDTVPADWRMPSEFFFATPRAIPDHYFAALRWEGKASTPAPDTAEGAYFLDGIFLPFGARLHRTMSIIYYAVMLTLILTLVASAALMLMYIFTSGR